MTPADEKWLKEFEERVPEIEVWLKKGCGGRFRLNHWDGVTDLLRAYKLQREARLNLLASFETTYCACDGCGGSYRPRHLRDMLCIDCWMKKATANSYPRVHDPDCICGLCAAKILRGVRIPAEAMQKIADQRSNDCRHVRIAPGESMIPKEKQ